jgi:hypothetical protein
MKTLFFLLAFSNSVFAQIDGAKVETSLSEQQKSDLRRSYLGSSADKELALKLLRLDFAPYIKKLDRDIETYNYRKPSEFSSTPVTDLTSDSPSAVSYANQWAVAATEHKPNETGFYGWGLYTARDPNASASYGRENYSSNEFNLVTVTYPKGATALDVRKFRTNVPISQETLSVLGRLCPSLTDHFKTLKNYYGSDYLEYMKSIDKKELTKDPACNEIYVDALKSFNTDLVIYAWNSNSSNLCESSARTGAAFVAIGQNLDASNLDYFTKLPQNVLDEAKAIQQETNTRKRQQLIDQFSLGKKTFLDYEKMAAKMEAFGKNDFFDSAFAPFLNPDPKFNKAQAEEFKDKTMECEPEHEEADKVTYNPDRVWEVMLEDSQILQTLDKGLKSLLEDCKEN